MSTITSPSKTQSTRTVDDGHGVVRCHHQVELSLLTSKSANNPGRQFYTCFKDRGDPDKCTFFKWADELANDSQSALVHSAPQPMTPPKRVREGTPSTPTSSPSKSAPFDRSSDMSPAKKRFKFQRPEEMLGRSAVPRGPSEAAVSPSPPVRADQRPAICDDLGTSCHVCGTTVSHALSHSSTTVAGDLIQQAVDTLGTVPEIIRRLERKTNAAEKARDAKAARIIKLEEAIQDLKDRNQTLENAMEVLLKARR